MIQDQQKEGVVGSISSPTTAATSPDLFTMSSSTNKDGKAERPTLRLSISSSNKQRSSSPTPPKKRKYNPASNPTPSQNATAAQSTLLHQSTHLNFIFDPTLQCPWYVQGTTTLYLLEPANGASQLGLHVRSSCRIDKVQVSSIAASKLTACSKVDFFQTDPLAHVLVRPAATTTVEPVMDADSQSSRGAAGMTTGLRAASIASNMGELRIMYEKSDRGNVVDKQVATNIWLDTLQQSNTSTILRGRAQDRTLQAWNSRSSDRRLNRIKLVAAKLAEPSATTNKARGLQVQINFTLVFPARDNSFFRDGTINTTAVSRIWRGAGWHAFAKEPHIYTTTGVFGDHEGPRGWLPTLDSASPSHRASQVLNIALTAPMHLGLSVMGMGEDMGCQEVLLHESIDSTSQRDVLLELGTLHIEAWKRASQGRKRATETLPSKPTSSHVIPPDSNIGALTTLDDIWATVIWCSGSWTPVPARSLGWAVGPWRIVEDGEYFHKTLLAGLVEEDDDDSADEDIDERKEMIKEAARQNGEGIRHVYLCPIYARKFIHSTANKLLLPNTRFNLKPLSSSQTNELRKLDQAISVSCVGVPYRASLLMKDVLALPTFRTVSYTQIWIPNAVDGGSTSGALMNCPEVLVNPFLGGSIMDSKLLAPVGMRLPFHHGGKVIQFLQARNAVRGWVYAALPLGGNDDVGNGYLHSMAENFFMSVYERGHGAMGEGGAAGSVFFSKRYSVGSGLNSPGLEFLPVKNVEELDLFGDGIGGGPVEDHHNDELWRSATNGTESHTSSVDEYNIRLLLNRDAVEAIERGTDKDKNVPCPSMGWFGSHLSMSFLSSNAATSSDLGCGAVELMHPVGGLVYRSLKSNIFRSIVEGRAGIANYVRLLRAAFIAAHLDDVGEKELKLPTRKEKKSEKKPEDDVNTGDRKSKAEAPVEELPKPPFVICVNEILKKRGLTHTLFTRALQNLAGRAREPHLLGTLVDVERHAEDPRSRRPFVEPEGFPNAYVRGSSLLYLRVGVQVDQSKNALVAQSTSGTASGGVQMQTYAEPVIPEGGVSYGGPITIRVVENEGQFREYVKDLTFDGSRRDWGTSFLHAKPVTTAKAQTAASGTMEVSATKDVTKTVGAAGPNLTALSNSSAGNVFSSTFFHSGGYQAIELIRLTNLTPLLWVRVDPANMYGGRISVFQPDACLAEQLFHDGDSAAQADAIRALAERPLRIQSSTKVSTVHDVSISELPVRVLGDCLRGSPALHSSLPHTPVVRCQAALAISQWQNNKAPATKDSVGTDGWIGMNLLLQYFRERFYSNSVVMPIKYSRLALKKNEVESRQSAAANEGSNANQIAYDDGYQYLDSLQEGEERATALEDAEQVEIEEDEEYRCRSAVVTAISGIRAQDGQTPSIAIKFLETVLQAEDAEMVGTIFSPEEELIAERNKNKKAAKATSKNSNIEADEDDDDDDNSEELPLYLQPIAQSFTSCHLIADALLALCNVSAAPTVYKDPTTGKVLIAADKHPVETLINISKEWLEWELYREEIRIEQEKDVRSGIGGDCYNLVASSAILALCNLVILKQSTTGSSSSLTEENANITKSLAKEVKSPELVVTNIDEAIKAQYYVDIFDSQPTRNDLVRAACAQAIASMCCAADRFERNSIPPTGLLSALEFLLERITDNNTSPNLKLTLSSVMMDACTGKVCSMQRVGAIGGHNDLFTCTSRYYNGPLGASHGGDNGSALLMSVGAATFPAASAVNDGARRGLRLLSRAGLPRETVGEPTVVRVATFATRLWRIINGEPPDLPEGAKVVRSNGVCAFNGALRCSLLSLWQWIWPKGCFAVLQVQAWKSHENIQRYKELKADKVMKISEDEKAAATSEEHSLNDLNSVVNMEIDRQAWRGEMVKKAYDMMKGAKPSDVSSAEQGIGQPLPPIQRDAAYKQGGWIASAAQQRRAMALDGGTAVTKLRLTVKSNTADG